MGVGAPPVVAVMVTKDPGSWFEECLESVAAQDYENLSLLIVDNGSRHDPTERVADVLPSAFVRRLPADGGFSAAANEALASVEGAAFLLFLHDDVRLRPDVVTTMVAEAFRANAGIVGAKLVDWDDERVLRSVGVAVDAFGASAPLVDPGELDQSQHDSARNVFAVSSACMLVRSDLFTAVDGFSREIPFDGEDVDLCWRTHAAGASVQFCPGATVAHRERFAERTQEQHRSRREVRHEFRMVLANTEMRRLWWKAPLGLLLGLVDLVGSLLVARFGRCGDIIAAATWNLLHLPALVRARARARHSRRVHDADFRSLVHRGSFRLRTLVRTDDGEGRLAAATRTGRGALSEMTSVSSRAAAALIVAVVLIALYGARDLFLGSLPVLRELVSGGDSSTALVSQWWTAWRDVGLGEPSVPVGLVPAFGAVGTVLLGSLGAARRLLILAPLVVGALGAWKMLSGTRSIRGRSAALAVYVLSPVALNALATGRLQALVLYAAAPWFLRRVARQAALTPFTDPDRPRGRRARELAGNALILGAVACVSPIGSLILVVAVSVFASAAWVGGDRSRLWAVPAYAFGGLLLSLPLQLPWLVESILRGDPASLSGLWGTRAAMPSAVEMMTGNIGPVGTGWLGWGILVAALVPLATGRSWRLGWAVGGWVVAFASFAVTSACASAGVLGGAGAALLLVPAVLGLSVAVAMGPLAFENDVVSADFGAGQILSGVGAVALLVGLVPIALAATQGRWYLPDGDYQRALDLVDRGQSTRTLWVGDPDVLPVSGWTLSGVGELAVGVTEGNSPIVTQRYRLDGGSGVEHLREAVQAAIRGRTSRLGRLLAPMGIEYVLVIDRPAPEPFADREVPVPEGAIAGFDQQLDLVKVPLAPGAELYRVAGTWPLRSDISALDLPPGGVPTAAGQLLLQPTVPPAVLGAGTGTSFSGRLDRGAVVAQSVSADPGWSLGSGGATARRRGLFGWAQQFEVPRDGTATLAWSTPLGSRALQVIQVVALVGLVAVVLRRRGGGRSGGRAARRIVAHPPSRSTSLETQTTETTEASVEEQEKEQDESLGSTGSETSGEVTG